MGGWVRRGRKRVEEEQTAAEEAEKRAEGERIRARIHRRVAGKPG